MLYLCQRNVVKNHQRLISEWTRNSRYEAANNFKVGEEMKVSVKEWRVMSDRTKQILLKAVATK